MTKTKICGLRTPDDIALINKYKPDFAGVILAQGFKRTVTADAAKELRRALLADIPLVGVFVDDDEQTVVDCLSSGLIDIAQLHGNESDGMILSVKRRTGKPVWKVFRMSESTDIEAVENCPADLVVLDAGTGEGRAFNWELAENIERKFVLAGGLTPENVALAIAKTAPFAVDTSSGVELGGRKNEEKIAAFLAEADKENKNATY